MWWTAVHSLAPDRDDCVGWGTKTLMSGLSDMDGDKDGDKDKEGEDGGK